MINKFSERLKDLRVSAGLSQRQLSVALNKIIKQSSIARWEQNECIPNLDSVILIAEYFNVSLDYLAGLED